MPQDAVSFAESFEATLLSSSLISTNSIPSSYGSLVIAPPLIVTGVVHVRSPPAQPRRMNVIADLQ
jgi:hypothetical protein